MASSTLVPVKEADFLDEDPEIRGQKYVCLSFISPEDVIMQKDVFFFHQFLGSFSKDMTEFFTNMMEKYAGNSTVCDMMEGLRQRYDYIFGANELQETYNFFKQSNSDKLESEYLEKNAFQTSVRGIKIRGAYETFPEAQKRAENVRKIDNKFDVYVAQVGCWCPWAPHPENVGDVEYANTQLNTLMKKYKENMDNKDELYRIRKEEMLKKPQVSFVDPDEAEANLQGEIEAPETWEPRP